MHVNQIKPFCSDLKSNKGRVKKINYHSHVKKYLKLLKCSPTYNVYSTLYSVQYSNASAPLNSALQSQLFYKWWEHDRNLFLYSQDGTLCDDTCSYTTYISTTLNWFNAIFSARVVVKLQEIWCSDVYWNQRCIENYSFLRALNVVVKIKGENWLIFGNEKELRAYWS